jgi:hypothetical protein
MTVIWWKAFCAVLVALSAWFSIVVARDVWNTLRTGSTRYTDRSTRSVSRKAQPAAFWLFIALNLVGLAFFAGGGALFALVGLDLLPTAGLLPDRHDR